MPTWLVTKFIERQHPAPMALPWPQSRWEQSPIKRWGSRRTQRTSLSLLPTIVRAMKVRFQMKSAKAFFSVTTQVDRLKAFSLQPEHLSSYHLIYSFHLFIGKQRDAYVSLAFSLTSSSSERIITVIHEETLPMQ